LAIISYIFDKIYVYLSNINYTIPEVQWAMQVCYSLQDIETRKREINALPEMSRLIDVKRWIVITKDEEEIITVQGITVEVFPVWRWLCSE